MSKNVYESLTPIQKEVLKWRAYGLSKDKVAKKLNIAKSTMENRLWAAYERLGIEKPEADFAPAGIGTIIYWQNNLEELKSINIEDLLWGTEI